MNEKQLVEGNNLFYKTLTSGSILYAVFLTEKV